MGLPNLKTVVLDGGTGAQAGSAEGIIAWIGPAVSGAINAVLSLGSQQEYLDTFTEGLLVDRGLLHHTGPTQKVSRAVRAAQDIDGVIGASSIANFTKDAGTGNGVMQAAMLGMDDDRSVLVEVTADGDVGTAEFKYSFDGGTSYEKIDQVIPATGVYPIEGTEIGLFFGDGVPSFVTGDTWTFDVVFVGGETYVSLESSPGGSITVAAVAPATSPSNAYDGLVEILGDGALGVATFRYSLDGGDLWSAETTVPVGGVYNIADANIELTFVGTFVAGDSFGFISTSPGMSLTSIQNAIDALFESNLDFGIIAIAGPTASPAWTLINGIVDGKVPDGKFVRAITEVPNQTPGETDAEYEQRLIDEQDGLELLRVGSVAGRVSVVMPLTTRQIDINVAPLLTGRLAVIPVQRSAGRVRDGGLDAVTALAPEGISFARLDALDDARYTVAMQHPNTEGFYIGNSNLFGGATSDFKRIERGRTMDKACRLAHAQGIQYLNDEFDGSQGDLDAIKAAMEVPLRKMASKASGRQEIVDGTVIIPAGQDVIGTGELLVKIRIVPVGTIRELEQEISFTNLSLA